MALWRLPQKQKNKAIAERRLCVEHLEQRRLLAIVWANEFGAGSDDPEFDDWYDQDEIIARQIVNRAISDWNAVITDQNFDNDDIPATTPDLELSIFADDFGFGAFTNITEVTTGGAGQVGWTAGVPISATIQLEDDNDGFGWFFDTTPEDDAEFTAIATPFEASFVDVEGGGTTDWLDFYLVVTHEIGHALGIGLTSVPNGTLRIFSGGNLFNIDWDGNGNEVDTAAFGGGGTLAFFEHPDGTFTTLTPNGGGHIYEGGQADHPLTPTFENELMNPGRTNPSAINPPLETRRQFISDTAVRLLADAYNYTVELPSTIDTAHVTLDSQTGVLLVQGRTGGLNDTITVDTVGSNIVVEVNNTTETISVNQVQRIVVAGNGGTDTIDYSGVSLPVEVVHYVVSSNEDSANAGTLGDGIVDLDPVVPGAQVALRAAIRDANAAGSAKGIYVPRGNYLLELTGSDDNASAGDLDITGEVTIVGAGAGSTIIDSGGSGGIGDRVFDVRSSGELDLSHVTATGGWLVPAGGGIRVQGALLLTSSAVVDNRTTSVGAGIYSTGANADTTILNSVIANNHAENSGGANQNGGAVYATSGALQIGNSIIANNTADVLTGDGAADLWGGVTVISSLGDISWKMCERR